MTLELLHNRFFPIHYGAVSPVRKSGFLIITVLLSSLSAVSILIPWNYCLLLNLTIVLTAVLLLNPKPGLFLLLFTVPVSSFTAYIVLIDNWNFLVGTTRIDLIPLYAPLIILTFAGVLVTRWAGLQQYQTYNPLKIPILILLCYAALTLLWTGNFFHSLFQFSILLMNIMLFFLLAAFITNQKTLKTVLWCWLLSISFQAVFSIASFFLDSTVLYSEFVHTIGIGYNFYGSFLQPSGWPQVASGLQDHHETALLMNMTIPVALGLLLTKPTRLQKKFLVASIALMIFVTLRTESRAGFGGLLFSCGYLAVVLKKLRNHFFLLITSFLLFIVIVYAMQQVAITLIIHKNVPPRLMHLGIKMFESGNVIDPEKLKNKNHSRKRLYKKSFAKYSRVIIQGFGVGNLKKQLDAPHAHSIFFSLLFDFGITGVFFMSCLAVYLASFLVTPFRRQSTELEIIAVSLSGGLISIAIQGLVDFEYNTTTLWLFLGLISATLNLARLEKRTVTNQVKPIPTTFNPVVKEKT